MPIGIVVALAAPAVLPAEPRHSGGRFDLPGAVTGTVGVAAILYGLSNAATGADGTSHWADPQVVATLTAGVVLLAAFAAIEMRGSHALLPVRLLRSRDRAGAYLMMLAVGTAVFGVFFFVTLFVQDVWGYSALRTGMAFLPLTAATFAASGAAAGDHRMPQTRRIASITTMCGADRQPPGQPSPGSRPVMRRWTAVEPRGQRWPGADRPAQCRQLKGSRCEPRSCP